MDVTELKARPDLPPPYDSHEAGPPPVMVQPVVTVVQVVTPATGPNPSPMTCPSCNQQIISRVDYKSNLKTHYVAAAFCIAGCICCMCIPYCVKTCKTAEHYCPNCNAYIGNYNRTFF